MTPIEEVILGALIEADGAYVHARELATWALKSSDEHAQATVRNHISGIRREFGFEVIENVHGMGYRWTKGSIPRMKDMTTAERLERARCQFLRVQNELQEARL